MEWFSSIYMQQYGIIFSSIGRWRQKEKRRAAVRAAVGEWVSLCQWVRESVSESKREVKKRSKKNHWIKMNIGTMSQACHNKKQTMQLPHAWEARTPTLRPNTEAVVRRDKTSIRPLRRIQLLSSFECDYYNQHATWKSQSTRDLVECIGPLGNAHWLIHVNHAKEADPKVPGDICEPGQ